MELAKISSMNPLKSAIENAQKAFEGEAERLGLQTEDDVAMVEKITGVKAR